MFIPNTIFVKNNGQKIIKMLQSTDMTKIRSARPIIMNEKSYKTDFENIHIFKSLKFRTTFPYCSEMQYFSALNLGLNKF